MDAAPVEPVLTAETLREPVRAALGSSQAEPLTWTSTRFDGLLNPTTRGVYRVTGTARDGDGERGWSLIIKGLGIPPPQDGFDIGDGTDPSHWNEWRREIDLYESDLFARYEGPIVLPRFYAATREAEDFTWLWIEDLHDDFGGVWPVERILVAAEHLGRFNGSFATRPLPDTPWLSRHFAGQWARLLPDPQTFVEEHIPEARTHPVVRFLTAIGPYLDTLDGLPQTFCHLDSSSNNLFARPGVDGGEETVAIDWALCGIAPVGVDLSQLAGVAYGWGPPEGRPVDAEIFARYCAGLRAAGWDGDEQAVRFAYVAFMVLRLGLFGLLLFRLLPEAMQPRSLDDTILPMLEPFAVEAERLHAHLQL